MMNKKPRIFIIDDCKVTSSLFEKILSTKYEVIIFNSATLARERLFSKKELPELILLDINMPELSGLDLCKEIKRDQQLMYVPIIFVSGNEQVSDIINGIKAGASDYIVKPIQIEIFKIRIENLIRMKSLQEQQIESINFENFNKLKIGLNHKINNDLMIAKNSLDQLQKKGISNIDDSDKRKVEMLSIAIQSIEETCSKLIEVDKGNLVEYIEGELMVNLE